MKTAVAINVYTESYLQIEECFLRIGSNLSSALVHIFINGSKRPEIDSLARSFGFECSSGINYGTNEYWHLWWVRMLRFFKESRADVCLKLDPDTMVDDTPIAIPDFKYFGDVKRSFRGVTFVQGGVTGLSQAAVSDLLESHVLEPHISKPWIGRVLMRQTLMDDQLLAVTLKYIGIQPTRWGECRSEWRTQVLNHPIEHAIVHPRYYVGQYRRQDK